MYFLSNFDSQVEHSFYRKKGDHDHVFHYGIGY